MDLAFDVFFCDLERPEAILNNDDAFDKSGEILKLSLTFVDDSNAMTHNT